MLEQLQKRYWVFDSPEYECSLGMRDFVASFNTKKAAFRRLSQAAEWGAIFDSHTGKQWDKYRSGVDTKPDRVC